MTRTSMNDYVQSIDGELDAFFNASQPQMVTPQEPPTLQRNEEGATQSVPPPETQVPETQTQQVQPVTPEGGVPPVQPVAQPVDEIAELKAEIQRLKSEAGRTKELARQLREMKQAQQAAPQTPPAQQPIVQGLTEDERLAIGDDGARVVNRVAGNTDEALRQVSMRLKSLEEQNYKQGQAALWQGVSAKFGDDIFEVQETEAYSAWCDKVDPITGKRNGDLLTACVGQLNQRGVEALITNFVQDARWVSKRQATAPAVAVSSSPQPTTAVERPAVRPAVSASTNVQSVTPPTHQPRIYTREEIAAIDRRMYSNRPEDMAWRVSPEGKALIRDALEVAVFEGRIR